MICNKCGKENREGARFCGGCGASISSEGRQNSVCNNYPISVQPIQTQPQYIYIKDNNTVPPEYKPISAWGYFGYSLLFSLPFLGFIFLLCFALGSSNINVRNFATSHFCIYIIIFVIMVLFWSSVAEILYVIASVLGLV